MYKQIAFHGERNERTGYGVHSSRFTEQLSKLISINFNGEGDVHVSLLDVVTTSQTTTRHPYPSILYSPWESTEYPAAFMDKIKLYDQLWVPSEWQRACSIAQGIPEEFVKVVPEGVDGEIYKPANLPCIDAATASTFDFLHVGQWQPRKSTQEICEAFIKAFPKAKYKKVRLYLSVDTLFPSDTYKSTEERLKAYGLEDLRIIPIHFEPRDAYIRRLQSAHVFVTCARSEGWNLPLIEAMGCGIPSIVADFGGSTEYAGDALNVRIRELKKPHGIYGDWDVPGQWGEPDYSHLVEVMRDAYDNYSSHKAKALITSTNIRTKFSWAAAAQKALDIIQAIPPLPEIVPVDKPVDTPVDKPVNILLDKPANQELSIRNYAKSLGYEIPTLKRRNAIFSVDCHADSQAKMDTLIESIKQIRDFNYPIILTSHLPVPAPIVEMVDYYIYDKNDPLSGEDTSTYTRHRGDGTIQYRKASIPCHALAALHNMRNALDFCLGKYDWVYQMPFDCEVDLDKWLHLVNTSDKPFIGSLWDNNPNAFSNMIVAGKIDLMDKVYSRIDTWEEFTEILGGARFTAEYYYMKKVREVVGAENVDILTLEIGNRFDQVDRNVWEDELFQCNFVGGPLLNIIGISNREYDVAYSNSTSNVYTLKQKPGIWSKPSIKYYQPWKISAYLDGEEKYSHQFDLNGRNVIISMGSKALGDTIAWIPYIEEFRKKHNCNVHCSTWWNGIMDYPEIKFIQPGDVVNDTYATYDVGCYDDQPDKNPTNWRLTPLQKVAADILGIDYIPLRAKLKYEPHKSGNGKEPKPYICFSEFSTMQNKMWNRPGAWQKIIDYLTSLGYDCVSISAEPSTLTGIVKHNGQSIEQTLTDISGATFYLGLNAGPTWLAYALDIPVIMLTGVSEPWNDFPMFARISIDVCKPGCFNDPSLPISRDWQWCPRNKNYACTREITETMVMCQIDRFIKEKSDATKTGKVQRSRVRKYKGDDGKRPSAEAGNRRGHVKRREIQTQVQA